MRTIVLSRANVVANGKNNTLTYNFPSSVDLTGAEVAVSNITMYYSWENINASPLANNTFKYYWGDPTSVSATTITLPAGLYELADINAYLQWKFIQDGKYLVNGSGQYVYYAELVINPTEYAVQVNTYPVPTSLPTGWSNPGGLTLPATSFTPVLEFPANFNQVVGFTAGFKTTYSTGTATPNSVISSTAPEIQPNSSVLVSLTGISNKYANPSSIIYSVAPNVALGELIVEKPAQFNWNRFIAGTYNQLTLQFLGYDLTPITIQDPNITIILCIRDMDDQVGDVGKETGMAPSMNAQIAMRNPASQNGISGKGLYAGKTYR